MYPYEVRGHELSQAIGPLCQGLTAGHQLGMKGCGYEKPFLHENS